MKSAPVVGTPIKESQFNGNNYSVVSIPGKRGYYFPAKSQADSRRKAEEYLAELMAQDIAREAARKQRSKWAQEANAIAPTLVNVGDIFYTSWGYEQTNIDFYQVIEKRGHIAIIREIGQNRERTYADGGTCEAVKDHFIGGPIKKKIQASKYREDQQPEPYFTIASYAHATKWDGKPKHWSDGY